MKKNSEIELKPRLRFPEFRDVGGWKEESLGEVADVTAGQSPSGANYNDIGAGIPFYQGKTDFGEIFINSPTKWTTQVTKTAHQGDILMSVRAPVGALNIATDRICIGRGLASIQAKQNKWFLYYFLVRNQRLIIGNGGSVFDSISKDQIEKIGVATPSTLAEQQKIADCLTSIDELIAAQTRKVDALKTHKKGLMQNFFPREDETQPGLRFPEFRGADGWEKSPLGDLLDYQQPTNYLVTDTKYNDMYKTPVLTAGKTFILGYTNEQHGIFRDNLPVIIFDDFTTATQFVDFPFKAKSSAMKILQAKNGANIKFMYEIVQMIAYEVGAHKRHWISKFAPMSILVPRPNEQQKIADCLTSVDELIAAQARKVDALKTHKKGLMQQLFPSLKDIDA